jgi:hypothetical protein
MYLFQPNLPLEFEATLDFLELCINLLRKYFAAKYHPIRRERRKKNELFTS